MMVIMKPKSNKLTLVLAIILALVFVPLAGLATYGKILYPEELQPTCDVNLPGGGCYMCENAGGYCNYALNYIRDDEYHINYYKGSNPYATATSGYAFIMDTLNTFNTSQKLEYPNVILYNSVIGINGGEIAGINNYGLGIAGNLYITINDAGKYGLFKIDTTVTKLLDYDYDFLGLANHIDSEGLLDSTYLIAKKNNEWSLITITGDVITGPYSYPIVDFNSYIAVFYQNDSYYVYKYNSDDYSTPDYLFPYSFSRVYVYQNLLVLVNNTNVVVYDTFSWSNMGEASQISSLDDLRIVEESDGINLYINDVAVKKYTYSGLVLDVTEEGEEPELTE